MIKYFKSAHASRTGVYDCLLEVGENSLSVMYSSLGPKIYENPNPMELVGSSDVEITYVEYVKLIKISIDNYTK